MDRSLGREEVAALLAIAFRLVAPPVGQMNRRLAPADGDVERQNDDGRA
jgi:hypothetical protein